MWQISVLHLIGWLASTSSLCQSFQYVCRKAKPNYALDKKNYSNITVQLNKKLRQMKRVLYHSDFCLDQQKDGKKKTAKL